MESPWEMDPEGTEPALVPRRGRRWGSLPEPALQAGLASLLGLESAGRRLGAGAGVVGPTLLAVHHPAHYRTHQGIIVSFHDTPSPHLTGTGGFVIVVTQLHAHHRKC